MCKDTLRTQTAGTSGAHLQHAAQQQRGRMCLEQRLGRHAQRPSYRQHLPCRTTLTAILLAADGEKFLRARRPVCMQASSRPTAALCKTHTINRTHITPCRV